MALRSPAQTLASFRRLVERLEQNRHAYDRVSFEQLRRILHRRIIALVAEMRGNTGSQPSTRRAA